MSAPWFPLALALHATGVVLALAPAPPPGRVPLGGLPGVGRRLARHLRPRRVGPRHRPRHPRRPLREPGRRRDRRLRRGPALGVVPRDVRRAGGAGGRLQRGLPGPRDPARPDRVRRRGLERSPDGGRDGVRGRRRPRLPRGLGADEPRHRRARRDRSREPAEPPLRLPLPRHVPPRDGLPRRRVLPPRRRVGLAGLRGPPRRRRGLEPVARPPLRPLPRGLRREGRHRPPARLAPRGAPGRSEQRLGPDVGGPRQRRPLRARPRRRGRPGAPRPRLGHGRPAPRLACRRSWGCSTR